MGFEEIGKARFTRKDTSEGLCFTIPSRKNWFIVLFLGFWMCGWAAGEVTVAGILIHTGYSLMDSAAREASGISAAFPAPFLLLWLGGWTVGGFFALSTLLWHLKGKEVILLSYNGLSIIKSIPFLKRKREYSLTHITDMRVSPVIQSRNSKQGASGMWSDAAGLIAFDYGAKTVRFGISLEEAEAKQILEEIASRHSNIVQSN